MVNDYSNKTFPIICAAISSKPNVDLELYDTNSLKSLSNGFNSNTKSTCDSNNLCTVILLVNFQFLDSQFNSLNSVSCSANSSNINVPLFLTTKRNVLITLIGIKNLF